MNFDKIAIVLVDTQLPENIGLVARSMYNFGFNDLRLVNPKIEWPSEKALAVSVDAKSIIEKAKVYGTLRESLKGVNLSIGYTARQRDMSKQFSDNIAMVSEINENKYNENIAIIFGGESSGLTNDHLSLITRCATTVSYTHLRAHET